MSLESASVLQYGGVPVRCAHLVGVGGTGMAGLARLLLQAGVRASGSDAGDGPLLAPLSAAGVQVHRGHAAEQVPADCQLLVRSAAVRDDNPEVAEARRRGLPVLKYAEAAGWLAAERRVLAVAGTHGKTTTSAMTAHLLAPSGAGYLIGGELPPHGGALWGGSELFVVEACEYDRSFLQFRPTAAAVTNVELDHLDYFRGGLDEIREAFCAFASGTSRLLVLPQDEALCLAIARYASADLETVAVADGPSGVSAEWVAERVELCGLGSRYLLVREGRHVAEVILHVPGRHNVLNSLMAVALAVGAGGMDPAAAAAGLESYTGVGRRFQVRLGGDGLPGPVVVDDYAHHPTEVRAVVAAARAAFPGRSLRVLFQPHQTARTLAFADGFAESLGGADEVLIAPIYAAREDGDGHAAALGLVRRLRRRGTPAGKASDLDDAYRRTLAWAADGAAILVLGAGDVWKVADRLVAALSGPGRAVA